MAFKTQWDNWAPATAKTDNTVASKIPIQTEKNDKSNSDSFDSSTEVKFDHAYREAKAKIDAYAKHHRVDFSYPASPLLLKRISDAEAPLEKAWIEGNQGDFHKYLELWSQEVHRLMDVLRTNIAKPEEASSWRDEL